MLFFYLLLAHLVSDYLLQPDYLVAWKNYSKWGLYTHSFIHFLSYCFVLYAYTGNFEVIGLALILAVFHFLIDSAKAVHDKKKKNTVLAYWIDQTAHYISILLVSLLAWQLNGPFLARAFSINSYLDILYFNPLFITYFSVAIFSTLTIEYSYYKRRKRRKEIVLDKKKMVKRLFIASLIYIGMLFALVPSVGIQLGG